MLHIRRRVLILSVSSCCRCCRRSCRSARPSRQQRRRHSRSLRQFKLPLDLSHKSGLWHQHRRPDCRDLHDLDNLHQYLTLQCRAKRRDRGRGDGDHTQDDRSRRHLAGIRALPGRRPHDKLGPDRRHRYRSRHRQWQRSGVDRQWFVDCWPICYGSYVDTITATVTY
jgi:hypothetical protein